MKGARGHGGELVLPSPSVRFGDDYVRRIEALHLAVRGRADRREGSGRSAGVGEGMEFVGYRPYRAGEDLRRLDWNLLGRLDRAFIRVMRRESSERWALLVDTSGSMGVGPPGKLQWAAEVAGALAALALASGASVDVLASDEPGPQGAPLRRRSELQAWMRRVEGWRAGGSQGLGTLLEPARLRGADRVIAIGDFMGLDPARVGANFARGREWSLVQVLAPDEVSPTGEGGTEWWDAEGPERAVQAFETIEAVPYERALERELERWDEFATRHRVRYVFRTSSAPFEEAVLALLS